MEAELKEIVSQFDKTVYNIHELMETEKTFHKFTEKMYLLLNKGFEIKEYREYPIKYKFHEKGKIYTSQFRHFITYLYFWRPFAGMDEDIILDESHILDTSQLSQKYVKSYIDNKIIKPFRDTVSLTKMNTLLADMIFQISNNIVTDYALILGLSINIETFMHMANKNERFNEIIRTKLDETMQPTEIEAILDKLSEEQIQILMTEDNMLQPFLKSGSGIKPKQLAEFSISGGLKPDLTGNTIPKPINSNLIVGGLNSVSNYFIDATSGRKSLIMNKSVMGTSGYFSKKVMLLATTRDLDRTGVACNTLHPLEITIEDGEEFSRLVDRYYRPRGSRQYRLIKETDTHLIGQTIFLKSPLTCASNHGICHECYGRMYNVNYNMNVGSYAGAITTEPINQSILSSKHLLTTISQVITFEPVFDKFFTLVANEIHINSTTEDVDLTKYSLVIFQENIVVIDDISVAEFNMFTNVFFIKKNFTGEMIEIRDKESKDLFLSKELIDMMHIYTKSKEHYELNLSKIPENTKLFILEVGNNELTKPLYSIMRLLDNKSGISSLGITSLEDMVQCMMSLLIQSDIKIRNVHAETILSNLIRSKTDILKRPDFSKYNAIEDSQILTISTALEKHPSVTVSLAFQYLGRQLLSPLTFRKTDSSFVDYFLKD